MFRFDRLESVRKPNISYPQIRVPADVQTDTYQGVRNVRFLMFSERPKRNIWKKKAK